MPMAVLVNAAADDIGILFERKDPQRHTFRAIPQDQKAADWLAKRVRIAKPDEHGYYLLPHDEVMLLILMLIRP